jgi:hypothetical protein
MSNDAGIEITTERTGKSGQQKGRENVEKVRAYVNIKRQRSEPLPGNRDGQPNLSAIAFECEFDRGVFRDNPEARAVIEDAAKELGITTEKKESPGRIEHTEKRLEKSNRRVQELEGRLAVVIAERDAFKRENRELKEKLHQYTVFEEVMTTNGRRFIA